uniref:Uncharacterized protein n=1 Tax=viral metagenome TaxID=1070528 RepID=A0A6M3KWC3_9ZZZZ
MADKKKFFNNEVQPRRMVSVHQLAKDLGTTSVSLKKWLDENKITIHKIGLSRIVWTTELMCFLDRPVEFFAPIYNNDVREEKAVNV